MKILSGIAGLACMFFSLPSLAIILDCELNVDGTYTCVEIGGVSVSPEVRQEAAEAHRIYVEQAAKECELRPYRRRASNKGGGTGKSEDIKRAEKEYKQCIATKAEALKAADQ